MTDHDELRDGFGAEIADALATRTTVGESPVDVGDIRRRAAMLRARRRTLVTALALAVVVVVGSVGIAVARRGQHGVRVETIATPSTTAATSPTPGHKLVSYRGVHVEVPSSWPVVDGMHTGFCEGPFPTRPTAFVGPQENGAPGCPYIPPVKPGPDGVWLQTEPRPTGAHPKRLPSGVVVLESPAQPRSNIEQVWYRGVDVEIGLGRDPAVSTAILDSIGYTSGVPDTPRAGVCARADSTAMPLPERLTTRLVLEHGDLVLDPVRPGDQPGVSAAHIWATTDQEKSPFEHYRLILARFTSRFPARPGPGGVLQPEIADHLAWIFYGASRSPQIEGCGGYVVEAHDTRTGNSLGVSGYEPGP